MFQPPSSTAVVWLASALQAATALLFHGLVLCVGPEGHTAIEWLAAGDCCPPPMVSAALNTDRCCDCTDASLLQPFADKRDGDRLRTTASLRVPLLAPPRPENPGASHRAARRPAPSDQLLARRDIILQI